MALSRSSKEAILAELTELLSDSKITVVANYTGTSVKAMQDLRAKASENGTRVLVTKNRLFKLALSNHENLKDADTSELSGQLLYAFNAEDEVAPAQSLYEFAKENPTLEFVGAISEDGTFMTKEQVTALAQLPSKEQLQAQLVGTIAAPLSGFVNVLAGNMRGLVNVLNARASELES